uniref:Uncharacterized protein n=1 Tax=Thermodesulfobacterium geofontis TaxID=1295609 RepID=A0A7V5XFL3_9BACT
MAGEGKVKRLQELSPEIYLVLVTAGMPFLFLIGTTPNTIAYHLGQFTTIEFFKNGILMGIVFNVCYFNFSRYGLANTRNTNYSS